MTIAFGGDVHANRDLREGNSGQSEGEWVKRVRM